METRTINTLAPSLAELKRHLRITATDLDEDLTAILRSAIMTAEHEIGTVIPASSFVLKQTLSCRSIKLRWPTTEVTSVKVDDVALESGDFTNTESLLILADGVEGEKVEVEYNAGLESVPDDIKSAILLIAGGLFSNPTDRPEERDRTTARNLLRPYRSWGEH